MTLPPRQTHALEQLGALIRDSGRIIGRYRAELEAGGMPPAEAFMLAQRLEERLFGGMVGDGALLCPECGSGDVVELAVPPHFMCIPQGHRFDL